MNTHTSRIVRWMAVGFTSLLLGTGLLLQPIQAANNGQLSTTARNAACGAVTPLLNGGYLRIYDGTQPADADTAITTQHLLAELRWNATAFGACASSVATANAISAAADAAVTGTASWFRALESDGTTAVFDGSVGTSGSDINLSTTSIVQHAVVSISAFTYTQKAT